MYIKPLHPEEQFEKKATHNSLHSTFRKQSGIKLQDVILKEVARNIRIKIRLISHQLYNSINPSLSCYF